jgi:hypothetical protein
LLSFQVGLSIMHGKTGEMPILSGLVEENTGGAVIME